MSGPGATPASAVEAREGLHLLRHFQAFGHPLAHRLAFRVLVACMLLHARRSVGLNHGDGQHYNYFGRADRPSALQKLGGGAHVSRLGRESGHRVAAGRVGVARKRDSLAVRILRNRRPVNIIQAQRYKVATWQPVRRTTAEDCAEARSRATDLRLRSLTLGSDDANEKRKKRKSSDSHPSPSLQCNHPEPLRCPVTPAKRTERLWTLAVRR